MATITGKARRPDYGRLIMIPTALGFVVLDTAALVRGSGTDPLHWVSTGLVCAFYALIVWCYLRRGPASATSRSVTAHAAAVTAMCVPFAFPLLRSAPAGGARLWAGDALVAGGTAWAVWSLRSLGRSVAVLAQARALVDRGPYRWVRHPLYTGEIVSSLGLALLAGTGPAVAVWLGFCFLQAYRAVREEQLLVAAMPAYRGYRARTAALFPGLFLSPVAQPVPSPSRRAAFHFRIFGRTSGLIGSASKSASQRSGVISG
jgi:protein-S-isoprenylcysteine O-methyltransferase Ste14